VGTVVSGTEIYMNLGPLIIVSGIGLTYMILGLHQSARKRAAYEQSLIKRVGIEYKGRIAELNMFMDTGCRLYDPVNDRPAVIAELRCLKIILEPCELEIIEGCFDVSEAYMRGLRVLNMRTVSGEMTAFGIVADRIFGEEFEVKNITVALVKNRISEQYNGIMNPEILNENICDKEYAL